MAAISKLKILQNVQPTLEVALRPLSLQDKFLIRKWLSDPYIVNLTFVIPGPSYSNFLPFSKDAINNYFNTLLNDKARRSFAILVDKQHVGNIGLKSIDYQRNSAECFIEIGEGEYRGNGIGTAAMAILMEYAFSTLELSEVRLEVLEFNHVAIRVYERIGFEKTHRTGWHYDHEQQYWQVWGMRLSRETWEERQNSLKLHPTIKMLPFSER